MATNEEMLVSAFQEKVAIRSCNIYLTQEMQNDWTMNIEQNVMSHTRITHDKFHTKKSKMAASRPFIIIIFFFSLSRKSCMIADTSSYFT